MANTVRIKRSTGSSAPTSLANAELAFAEGNKKLFIGIGTGGAGGSATTIEAIGGSGSFAIGNAKASGADAYVTADLKYHDFFQAENNILLADIGHYESEQYTKNGLVAILTKKIPNFAFVLSNTNTNPVKYF